MQSETGDTTGLQTATAKAPNTQVEFAAPDFKPRTPRKVKLLPFRWAGFAPRRSVDNPAPVYMHGPARKIKAWLVWDPAAPVWPIWEKRYAAYENRRKKELAKRTAHIDQNRKDHEVDPDLFAHDGITAASIPEKPAAPVEAPAPPVVAPTVPLASHLGILRYGKKFPPGTNDLTIELYAFRHQLTEEQGGLGAFQHFKNIVNLVWNRKGSPRRFIWSPWAEDMVREACDNMYLAVAGCASSGKSDTYALWAIVNYLAAPTETLVILTSTTLREARRRVWKSIEEFWLAAPGLPGKLVSSLGQIKGMNKGGGVWEGTGLVLVPSEKKAEREAVGKLVGIKQKRVILVADELPELPESIVHAAYSNLSNNPYFQMVGLGNPNSHFDAFGIFAMPETGWASISEADSEWKTARGKCIRFDAEQCPNVLEDRIVYPWMPTRAKIEQTKADYGEKSLAYYRMVRGFWAPDGVSSGIYSEADLVRGLAATKARWKGTPVPVAGLDPSFTAGGDRTICFFGLVGEDESGATVLQFEDYALLKEDIMDKQTPRTHQMAQQFIQHCKRRNVQPRHAGVDGTGGGGPFCDVLASLWGTDSFVRVMFGGAASTRPVSANDRTPANDRYYNRMSEIWYVGQELIRSGQLRNITPDLAREMVARQYETRKSGAMKIKVESKTEYKSRTGKSPDIADAAFIMLDVCRTRFGLMGNERFEVNKERQSVFKKKMMSLDAVYSANRVLF